MTGREDYFRRQLQLIETISSQLSAMKSRAESAREHYRQQLAFAAADGFMTDYTKNLGGEKFREFSRHIDEVLDTVDKSYRKLEEHAASIERMLRDAGHDGKD